MNDRPTEDAKDAVGSGTSGPRLLEDETAAVVEWCAGVLRERTTPFAAARTLAQRLGAHCRPDGSVAFGFWAPELAEQRVSPEDAYLEILDPPDDLSLRARRQQVRFRRHAVPIARHEEFAWAVVADVRAGTRDRTGSFYRLRYRSRDGEWRTVADYLAHSVPFGAFAPAEVYDVATMQEQRTDSDYYRSLGASIDNAEPLRMSAPLNILQIHVPTASAAGTISGLDRIYTVIADKLRSGIDLVAEEEPFVGYDAVQLLPVEPTIEYEAGPSFWSEVAVESPGVDRKDDREGAPGDIPEDIDGADRSDYLAVDLLRPDMTNWGYDILISASSAVNPTLLETARPDELVDFSATLHNFPTGPIKLIFDVVFGHADNQAVPLISRHFFTGPNMYGQDMNYRHPVVRAIMLEMQRRKINLGADGVRIDGAQDFKYYDHENHVLRHDDEYLAEMGDVVQEVCGVRYRPWMIFEDGRPWPQEDWELSSTYRDVVKNQKGEGDAVQWGPLTFAHNTPFLYTFWISKFWRIREIMSVGDQWISGTANHDTLRRGYQVETTQRINTRLGDTLQDIIETAYDNPAASLFTYAMMPGIPMDFINASMRASWGFIRNTDDAYGVKVVSEEAGFMDWQVDEDHYSHPGNFRRLKDHGFAELSEIRRFLRMLQAAVVTTDYDLQSIVTILSVVDPKLAGPENLDVPALKTVARAFMDDLHDYCNISYYKTALSSSQTAFNRSLRAFRRERPWLRRALSAKDVFDVRWPVDGTVLFYGLRNSPDGSEQMLFLCNMEGGPVTLTPAKDLPIDGLSSTAWQIALCTRGLEQCEAAQSIVLSDSQGLVYTRAV